MKIDALEYDLERGNDGNDKKFSPEFQHDIADLLECCQKNETDSLTITMNYGEFDLDIDITFSIHPHEEGADDGNNNRQTD